LDFGFRVAVSLTPEEAAASSRKLARTPRQAHRPDAARPAHVPADAVEFGGHWYKPYRRGMTWHEAKRFCEEQGGHLVTVTSDEERSFVEKLARSGSGVAHWIGLSDEDTEGEWRWVTGEKLRERDRPGFLYSDKGGERDAVMIRGTGWHAWPIQEHGVLICEWEPDAPPPTLTLDLGKGVKMEFVYIKPGVFNMGGDLDLPRGGGWQVIEKPKHEVAITRGFYIGRYEVTQAQYEAVMGQNRSKWKEPSRPAEHVLWNETVEFCLKLSQRSGRGFTATIPGRWIRKGLEVTVKAGEAEHAIENLNIGPPIRLDMTMFDVHYFGYEDVDYPEGWEEKIAVKRPVTELSVQKMTRLLFPELVIPPCGGQPAVRCTSTDDYQAQTGKPFNGKQAAALLWQHALQDAGAQRRLSLFFVNIANVHAGGFAEDFGGCGSLRRFGVLHHELAHALDVEDLCGTVEPLYPYRGPMHGIDKTTHGGYHVGPTWGYDPRPDLPGAAEGKPSFINPVNPTGNEKELAGEWRCSPVRGGGGPTPDGHTLRMFSDWSVRKMQAFMENRIVLRDEESQSYLSYSCWTERYQSVRKNNGVAYPVEADVEVYSIMVAVSAVTEAANFVYPLIGPYRSGVINTFDPAESDDRRRARRMRDVTEGWDICLRVTQGGTTRTYMMPMTWRPDDDPTSAGSFQTRALNVPVRDGQVTRAELLLTPEAEWNGMPSDPVVLCAKDFSPAEDDSELVHTHYSNNA
jgi:hypothetical protein